jgi:aminomethyltransferase
MPVQFSGLKPEHQAVRQGVGMFDISHMGKFSLTGQGILTALQALVPTDLRRLSQGKAQYTVLLNEQAGIIDDIIIYDQGQTPDGQERVTLIVNAATTTKDRDWLLAHLPQTVTLTDLSPERVLIAIQGPQAIAVVQPLVDQDLSQLPAFGHLETNLLGETVFIARTGYTGEDGLEMMLSPTAGQKLWQIFLDQGVVPCGLGARDTLRLEAAMGLYGQDMDDHTTPLEAGLGWLVHLDKPENFIGRSLLEQQKAGGVKKRLVGLEMQGKQIARHDYPILYQDQPVGVITSGTLSPTLNKAIALGYVPVELAKLGQTLTVAIRGKTYPIRVVKKPFYRSTHKPQ